MAKPAVRELTREVVAGFGRHHLMTYTAALSFQALVALVPLVMLGLAILAAAGLEDTWRDSLAPLVRERVTRPVYEAIDFSVARLLSGSVGGLIALSLALLLWYLTLSVRAIMEALNAIHDATETRSARRQVVTAIGLAIAVGLCLVVAVVAVTVTPRLTSGPVDAFVSVGRWLVAAAVLALAVGLLMRYAPAERPAKRWASAGSVLVIAAWIVASVLFTLYVETLADFKSPIGTLTVFLVLYGYVFTTSAIFLVGAEVDEILRTKSSVRR